MASGCGQKDIDPRFHICKMENKPSPPLHHSIVIPSSFARAMLPVVCQYLAEEASLLPPQN